MSVDHRYLFDLRCPSTTATCWTSESGVLR